MDIGDHARCGLGIGDLHHGCEIHVVKIGGVQLLALDLHADYAMQVKIGLGDRGQVCSDQFIRTRR